VAQLEWREVLMFQFGARFVYLLGQKGAIWTFSAPFWAPFCAPLILGATLLSGAHPAALLFFRLSFWASQKPKELDTQQAPPSAAQNERAAFRRHET